VVLAGGTSRRFGGTAKGLEQVGPTRIIDRVVDAIRQVTPDLLLVANDLDAQSWLPSVALVADKYVHSGGLAGVHSALSIGRNVLVVAWDMPFVSGRLLGALVTEAARTHASVVAPESGSPYGIEPFCAVYSAAVLPALDDFLRAGGGAAQEFLRSLPGVVRFPASQVARFGDPRRLFFSVNTPDDLARARTLAEALQ
jgi:molybdenum cofactor guanylyltransferase